MEIIKSIAMPLIWLVILLINVGALWRWNSSFVKKKDFDFKPEDYITAADCKDCKKENKVADEEVRKDIKNIKTAIVNE